MSTALPVFEELEARGLVADVTNRGELANLLATESIAVYAGFDPTADSLHVGHLVPMNVLKRLQLAGHRPIILVGGATGMIGDPSGKGQERNLLDDAVVAANVAAIRVQLARLLDLDDPRLGAAITNNADWTRGVSVLEFLRTVGKHLTLSYMMGKHSVRSRLGDERGISFTEFSYMLLQAFDFVQLSRSHDCRLQIGGSDQWGNITAGVELSHRQGGPQLYGMTLPLLLDSTGQKMGKTSTGERVWLDPARTSPALFHGYWRRLSDVDGRRLLPLLSLRPLGEVHELLAMHDRDPSQQLAQRELADGLTAWVHGAEALARA